ncbi:MAG: type II secretion system F family protein [Acidobacteria bacterium]|nr:type II secretion system F family protein [Acidobacteriota bacterium]
MTIALATFVIALALVFGTYWLLVVRPEAADRSATVARLRDYRVKEEAVSLVVEEARLSHIPLLDRLLSRRRDVTGPVERLLVEAGLTMTVGTFILTMFVAGAAGGVLAWMLTGMFSAAAVMAVVGALLPYLVVSRKRAVRLRVFEEQFPEAIDLISRALRAGHAFTTGLGMVADEIPAPVGQEFRRLYDEQNFGMSLPDAMRAMARRVPVLDARFFVTAVLTQRESGGNLSEVLDNLASVMRERFKLKRQIRVISAHGRISAWVLSALPPALAGILFLLSPDFMRILWEDPLGVRLILIAVVLQITGTIIISRMVRIEY